jgi:glycosyltransferase involved in cell wall biosynthesis
LSEHRIKILRLVPVLDFGGVESIVALQAQLLDHERFALTVCTFWKDGNAAARIRDLGITVDVLGVDPSIRNPAATLALARYLARTKPHIIHASIGEANLHAALVGKLHDPRCAVIMEETGLPNRRPVGRLVHAILYRLVDRVIGVSDASCRYVIAREYAPPSRVVCLYNVAKEEYFAPLQARPPREEIRFLCVGRLVPVKNHAMLIAAFAQVFEAHPHTRLTIAGDGPLGDALAAQIHALGLGGAVVLAGLRHDIRAMLDDADVFVLPSLSEGLSIALIEAMARGLPVISTTAGGVGDVVAPLGAGWSAPAQSPDLWVEQMARLAALDHEQRRELGLRARARAEDFHPNTHKMRLEGLYIELFERAHGRSRGGWFVDA